MDANGARLVIGERPPDLGMPKSEFELHSGKKVRPLLIERLEWKWRALPSVWKTRVRLGGILAGVLLFALIAYTSATRAVANVPKDLDGRARFVAIAFLRDQRSKIYAVTLPATDSELAEWLDRVRPKDWSTDSKSMPLYEIRTRVINQSMKNKKACVMVEFLEPGRPAAVPAPPPPAAEEETAAPSPEGTQEPAAPAETAPGAEGAAPKGAEGEAMPAQDANAETPAEEEPAAEATQPPPPPPPEPKLKIFLYWAYAGPDEGWLVDGIETLDRSGLRPKPKDEKSTKIK